MSKAQFDKTFGENFCKNLPQTPGIYIFKNLEGSILYVGKAKNLRRRLYNYRNASRRKVHRKMLTLVRESKSIEIRQTSTEQEALLLENKLICNQRPPYNVDGAFSFLYPSLGIFRNNFHTLFCFTINPALWKEADFQMFGTFRSRIRAKEAFDSLTDLLLLLGHQEPRSRLPELPKDKGSRIIGIRRIDNEILDALEEFLSGQSQHVLELLALRLLEKPRARQEARHVQDCLQSLVSFFERDCHKIFQARLRVGWNSIFVPQQEHDSLFIKAQIK